jgi:hypothetical protein
VSGYYPDENSIINKYAEPLLGEALFFRFFEQYKMKNLLLIEIRDFVECIKVILNQNYRTV